MNPSDILSLGAIEAIASQLGISPDTAQRGAEALLPAILGGMGATANAHPDQAAGLQSHLEALGGSALHDDVVGPQATNVGLGNDILGRIFGSKDVSRQVADRASQTSGLDTAVLKQMLPIPTMLAAGYLSKKAGGQQGGVGGILPSILASLAGAGTPMATSASGGGLGGILGSVLGGR